MSEPKMFAVFGPDGALITKAYSDEWTAWAMVDRRRGWSYAGSAR